MSNKDCMTKLYLFDRTRLMKAASLLFCFISSVLSAGVWAAEYATVTASAVKVRLGPGAHYDGISQLHRGHIVTLLQTRGSWSEIKFTNKALPKGKRQRTGWMASRFLRKDPVSKTARRNVTGTKTNRVPSLYTVNAGWLKIRNGPGKNFPGAGSLPRGQSVLVYGSKNGWAEITAISPDQAKGVVRGWVSKRYLTLGDSKKNTISKTAKKKLKPVELKTAEPSPEKITLAKEAAKKQAAKEQQQKKLQEEQHEERQEELQKEEQLLSDQTEKEQLLADDLRAKKLEVEEKTSFKDRVTASTLNTKPANENRHSDPEISSVAQANPSDKNQNSTTPGQAIPVTSLGGAAEGVQPQVALKLVDQQLACERNDKEQVQSCEMNISFNLSGQAGISKAKIRCEADLMVGMAEGDPVRYPLNNERVYAVGQTVKLETMMTKLEASGGSYTIRSVDLLNHRCAVLAFSRKN